MYFPELVPVCGDHIWKRIIKNIIHKNIILSKSYKYLHALRFLWIFDGCFYWKFSTYIYIVANKLKPVIDQNFTNFLSLCKLVNFVPSPRYILYILFILRARVFRLFFPNINVLTLGDAQLMEGETQVRMSRHENTRDTLLRCAASPTEIRFISQRRDVGLADIILDKCVRSHGKRRRGGKMPAQYERARPLCFQIASIFRHAGKSRDNYISISHESRDYIPLMQMLKWWCN